MRRIRRSILLFAIFLSLGGVAFKVTEIVRRMQKETKANPIKVLDYLPESALRLKDFHRAKIENGRKVWELFGEEANYFKEQKEAVVKKPRFHYYDKKGDLVKTTWKKWSFVAGYKQRFRVMSSNRQKPITCRRKTRLSCRATRRW